jgi:hypothetical protein
VVKREGLSTSGIDSRLSGFPARRCTDPNCSQSARSSQFRDSAIQTYIYCPYSTAMPNYVDRYVETLQSE